MPSKSTLPAARQPSGSQTQRGLALLELMVGITVGLLVVAAAMAALIASRGVAGAVNDASGIQQQATHAMRIIGQQVRQAGSLYLRLNPGNAAAPVVFETYAPATDVAKGFAPVSDTLFGSGSSITLGYRRYKEPVHTAATEQALARNCLGGPANSSPDQRVESIFQRHGDQLRCGGNDTASAPQPLVQNVADFQVRYLLQDNAVPGDARIQYVAADAVGDGNWGRVQAVEVCLVLYGNEPIDMPAGSTYAGCDGTAIDMTAPGERTRRMHMVFRSVFQLRSQGLVGTVL
jgi:type IV pilus assembly protein PilW